MADDIIGSVSDEGISSTPPAAPASISTSDQQNGIIGNINDAGVQSQDEYFGTPGQQLAAGVEGLGKGVLGPIAPFVERSFGVPGSDILAREHANPITHAAGELTGFAGSTLIPGLSEYGLAAGVGKIGEAAQAAAGLGEAAGFSKIAATGIKAGAELTALGASTELSKMVEGDPDQTLGSAAINIGLSGVIGGVGGAALGSISPLWDKTKNILGVDKLATDFMAETKAIQDAGDPLSTATNELKGRIAEADNIWKTMSDTKPEVLQKAMPAPTAGNIAKVDAQIQSIYDTANSALKKADQSIKTKSAVPFLYEDLSNFQDAVTAPNASLAEKFTALNKLKTDYAGYAKWSATEEGSAKAALGRTLSNVIRPALEDTSVWGAAGDVQKVTNEAISNMIDATKDFKPQVTSKLLGENDVAPEKVQTFLNQTNAGKASRKANVISNYLDATQKYADAINQVHLDNGLEAPITSKLNPTPVLNHALGTELTPGVALARWANKRGAAALGTAVGEAGASTIGGGLGALVGHPLLGAWAGEKVLGPIFSALAKPLAENAVDTSAAKSAVDYIGNAIKGQKVLSDSVSNVFSKGTEVLTKDLIPDQESRNKLDKSLSYFNEPGNATKVAGSLGHYLPQHATAAAVVASNGANYLNTLKPTQAVTSPLDNPPPIDRAAQAKYNRALDMAQQPLLALQHAKNGTLLPEDVQTLRTIYPALHDAMITKITNALIDHKSQGGTIPYKQKVSLNMLIGGNPIDGTMTPNAMQAIILSSGAQQAGQQAEKASKPKNATGVALRQINKVNALYQTPQEARTESKRS